MGSLVQRILDSFFTVVIFTLFLLSGIISNILWALLLPLWILNRKDLYRKYAKVITESWWRVVLFIPLHWSSSHMEIYSTDDLEEVCGSESAICLANHRYTVDWILDWIAAEKFNMLGQCKAFIKASVAKYPVIGWSMWFNEFVFLSREKNKDISRIHKSIKHLSEYSEPCWLLLYPEGTRFNAAKHAESMKFARENNLPELQYLLLPRPKGFNEIISNLHGSNVKAVYDCTFLIKDDFDVPITNWLKRKPTPLKMACIRIELDSIPTDPTESKKYIYNLFKEKDELFGKMLANQDASEYCLPESKFYSKSMKRRNKPHPMKPLYTTIFWFCLIMFPILLFLYRIFISSFSGFLMVSAGIAILNLGVAFLLETFHKKPSSYGLKKSN